MRYYLRVLLSIVLVTSAVCLSVASGWHELAKCSGQGCLFILPVLALLFLVGYALLAPAYIWLLIGRAWWGGLLALLGICLSIWGLYSSAGLLDARMYSSVFGWYLTYPESWPVQYLLWAQLFTLVLLLLKVPLQSVFRWLSTNDIE